MGAQFEILSSHFFYFTPFMLVNLFQFLSFLNFERDFLFTKTSISFSTFANESKLIFGGIIDFMFIKFNDLQSPNALSSIFAFVHSSVSFSRFLQR